MMAERITTGVLLNVSCSLSAVSCLLSAASAFHPCCFNAFRSFVLFTVVKAVMIFRFDNSGRVSGSGAAGWQEK